MTRNVDPFPEWSTTASLSIRRYRDLESRSGINFYSPVGYLGLGYPGSTYNARCAATGEANGVEIERLSSAAIRVRYPFLCVADEVDGLVENGGAGHISPRRMVEAQTLLAERAGATIMRAAARALRTTAVGVEVELSDGSVLNTEKALVATGAFTEPCGLSPVHLGLSVFGRTTVLVRIEGEAANALKHMPTMIDGAIGAYILPPIVYPDGHSYLKIGVGTEMDPQFTTLGDLRNWFKSTGSGQDREHFSAHLVQLIPVLRSCPVWLTDTCAVTRTASGLPIIDFVADNKIAVAVGGCGKGAKGSDEWGRLAADVVSELPWRSAVQRTKLLLSANQSAAAGT